MMESRRFDFLKYLTDAAAVLNSQGRVVFWNQAAEELYKIPAADALGQPISRLIEIVGETDSHGEIRKVVLENSSWRGETQHQLKDGQAAWVDWSVSKFELENGEDGYLSIVRNITEYKQAEKILKESEERFRSFMKHFPGLAYIKDSDGRILFANEKFAEFFGMDPALMQGKSNHDFFPPDFAEKLTQDDRRILSKGETEYIEESFGGRIWSTCKFPIASSETEPLLAGITIDITDRKRSAAGRKLQIDAINKISAAHDLENQLNICLDVAIQASGMDSGGIYLVSPNTGTIDLVIHKGLPPSFIRRVSHIPPGTQQHHIVAAGRPVYIQYKDLSDGKEISEGLRALSVIPILQNGQAIACMNLASHTLDEMPLDARGFIEFLAAEAGNYIARSLAEQALKQSQENLAEAQRQTHIGSFEFDFQTERLHWSEEMFRIFGIKREDFQNNLQDFMNRVHSEDLQRIVSIRKEGLTHAGPLALDFRILRPNGEVRFIRMMFETKFDRDGNPLRRIGTFQDITEAKKAEDERGKLEAQLQQAMKMEAIGRLAGGVAHDFNNLLTSIMGNVDLTLMDLKPLDPLAGTLAEINKAADSAAVLTRQLLAFSRKQLIKPKVLNLNELISRMHIMLARLIGEDIELKISLGKQLEAVKIDRGQFEQILVNLAVNARDAMPNGGKLSVETANIYLSDEYCRSYADSKPGRHVILAVSDTGQGMSEETKAHLFEPFFTTKEKGKGTGLGLAVIYGAVKQAGGFIQIYSEADKGTTFNIFLPCVEEKAESDEREERSLGMPGGNETILLVEDEDSVRNLAGRVLMKLGYKVLQANCGDDALAVAECHSAPIHLMLTDIVMPGMNGKELADRMAKIRPEMKVVYTSGYTENVITHHGVINEGLNFISKPYTPQALAKKLREVFGEPPDGFA